MAARSSPSSRGRPVRETARAATPKPSAAINKPGTTVPADNANHLWSAGYPDA